MCGSGGGVGFHNLIYVGCLPDCKHTRSVQCPRRPKGKGIRPPGTGVANSSNCIEMWSQPTA